MNTLLLTLAAALRYAAPEPAWPLDVPPAMAAPASLMPTNRPRIYPIPPRQHLLETFVPLPPGNMTVRFQVFIRRQTVPLAGPRQQVSFTLRSEAADLGNIGFQSNNLGEVMSDQKHE